ncbi:MAG: hypothetical protein ACOH2H_10365 [Cypionkella sp.]
MTRHQVETELSDIRREITRLQRRETQLLRSSDGPEPLPRPGWPMHRAHEGFLAQAQAQAQAQASGAIISISEPSRIAV